VVLLGYNAFLDEIQESHEGGEVIWARSTVGNVSCLLNWFSDALQGPSSTKTRLHVHLHAQ
jgi:hypothetical protein